MKKILIPIDFSPCSEYASKLASRIARKSDSEIHLLHMIELPTGVVDMVSGSNFSIPESMLYIRKVRDRMIDYKAKFFPKNAGVKHSIRFQNPFEGIRSYSEKIGADLIVMGSKGHSKIEEILIGSNTEKIVRTSKSPVLVVKNAEEKFKPEKLVFASSFKEGKDKALKKLLDFTREFKSEIHLLKVNTPQKFESTQESIKRIKNFIKNYNIPKYSINVYNDSSVEKGILNFANEINSDMIALGTHGRSGISHIFNGSITKHLSKRVSQPMLTFKI
ncbi:nucleotide-binding universal stress UspA family protein [Tenacibaculum adriaticum]|uniref:Nucleotide-binding universal stress UspA family protein n=1 Tax=Tenacibaculum adriaticum TaxID=413713 RepID=A0A5S5DYG3_9FLAO|nr:universal stress protein [Tenacibaculum adriaticum]TYQ00299.1 nucleotide-binding universal stress UspA family protein [Tenacibaculum adriaticum]